MAAFPRLRPFSISVDDRDAQTLTEIKRLRALRLEVEFDRAQFARQTVMRAGPLARLLHDLGYQSEALRALEEDIEHGSDPPRQRGVICDHYDLDPIIGRRYVCYVCKDCDLCGNCWD